MSSPSLLQRFSKWVELKIYQWEVTFSVYIFTPWEKFIFWSVVFLLFSLTLIATILYLPHHIKFIVGRAWFYMHGDATDALDYGGKSAVSTFVATSTKTAVRAATETVTRLVEEL